LLAATQTATTVTLVVCLTFGIHGMIILVAVIFIFLDGTILMVTVIRIFGIYGVFLTVVIIFIFRIRVTVLIVAVNFHVLVLTQNPDCWFSFIFTIDGIIPMLSPSLSLVFTA
jgi:hypothetical protein